MDRGDTDLYEFAFDTKLPSNGPQYNPFESEKECRETVPGELDQMIAKFGGWGHSNCLPLPTYGVAL